MKKIVIIFSLLTYSHVASAGLISDIWESLKVLLSINVTKTVNESVLPPAPVCSNAVGERPSPDSAPSPTPVSLSTNEENANEDKEKPEEGDEQEVGFTQKVDTDADEVSTQLIANFKKLGGDPVALTQALCFYDKNRGTNFTASGDPSRKNGIKIQNQRYITINDLNKNYFDSRMFVLDLDTGKVKSYYSSHGAGGKKGVAESDSQATEFSNEDGSNATPRGFFITGARVNGSSDPKQRWKFSMKLHGLQKGVNDKSYARAVVMHSFPDVTNDVASSDDEKPSLKTDPYPFYLSKGCTMVGPKVADEIINTIKAPNTSSGGSLYYNYTATEKARGESYCGDEGLMKK